MESLRYGLAVNRWDMRVHRRLRRKPSRLSTKLWQSIILCPKCIALLPASRRELWDWRGAEDEYRRTIELNPSDAEARACYAHVLWSALYSKGAYQEAVDALIALQMRNGRPEIVQALQRGGRQGYRAAFLAAAEAGESLSRSGRLSRAYQIAICYERAGLIDRALEWYEKALDERDPNLPYIRNSIRNAREQS